MSLTLAAELKLAQACHHEAEKRLPPHDWTDWYAAYIEAGRKYGFMNTKAVEEADAVIKGGAT